MTGHWRPGWGTGRRPPSRRGGPGSGGRSDGCLRAARGHLLVGGRVAVHHRDPTRGVVVDHILTRGCDSGAGRRVGRVGIGDRPCPAADRSSPASGCRSSPTTQGRPPAPPPPLLRHLRANRLVVNRQRHDLLDSLAIRGQRIDSDSPPDSSGGGVGDTCGDEGGSTGVLDRGGRGGRVQPTVAAPGRSRGETAAVAPGRGRAGGGGDARRQRSTRPAGGGGWRRGGTDVMMSG